MLVLTRKVDESIRIGDVVVKVLRIKGTQVRIGVIAPDDRKILRTELEERNVVVVKRS